MFSLFIQPVQGDLEDVRIFFLDMSPSHAKSTICKVSPGACSTLYVAIAHDSFIFIFCHCSVIPLLILIQAYKQRLMYPKYVFITYGWYPRDWWRNGASGGELECSESELAQSLHGAFALQQQPSALNINRTTDSDIVSWQDNFNNISSYSSLMSG